MNILNIDECISNPCHTNAKCIDGINSYICKCKKGFTGDGTTCTGNLITDNLKSSKIRNVHLILLEHNLKSIMMHCFVFPKLVTSKTSQISRQARV